MSAVFSGYDGCLKTKVGSTLDILLLFKYGNKPKTGRKQLGQDQFRPIRWVGGWTKGLLTSAASKTVLD